MQLGKQLHQKQTIVPVHLFGRAANMEAIMAIVKSITYVIEDNAQAIGANCKFSQ
jgi:dTDP-4-amino-4,6-dideoxygalactose transaminase